MKNREPVTVVIPTYNSEKWIGRCLESVLNQTYDNYEIICVDDGSSDNTAEICREYEKKGAITFLPQDKNHGAAYVRNIGISHANGRFITFVDSDDTVDKSMIDYLVKEKENNRVDWVIASEQIDGIKRRKKIYNGVLSSKEFCDRFLKNIPFDLFSGPCCKLYDMGIIRKNNIKFPVDMIRGEDCIFNLSYFKRCKSVAVINKNLYHYINANENSLSKRTCTDIIAIQERIFTSFDEVWTQFECSRGAKRRLYICWLNQCIYFLKKAAGIKNRLVEEFNTSAILRKCKCIYANRINGILVTFFAKRNRADIEMKLLK